MTVDKLGVKLYDKASAVLAELVSNSYDADSTRVVIRAPMDEYLASKAGGVVTDKGYEIVVSDDGIGMTPDEVNQFFLRVGAERRKEKRRGRGELSPIYKRRVMGRKGVGKLAPFGICRIMEVITSGGEAKVNGKDEKGKPAKGYRTAHLILDREDIVEDKDFDYEPTAGPLDETVSPKTGTTIKLRGFAYRQVPSLNDLGRQLAQRFGIKAKNWSISLEDSQKTTVDQNASLVVGEFQIERMEGTTITFGGLSGKKLKPAVLEDGSLHQSLLSGFECEGVIYPLTGWVAFSKHPFRDDLMSGVRIYCRGKIAAQTSAFERKAGFQGELSVRSYLVGEMHADWLDDSEDLIQTDRRDILWSDELGSAFQEWGKSVVQEIGKRARNPLQKRVLEIFRDKAKMKERANDSFPGKHNQALRDNAIQVAEQLGKSIRPEEAADDVVVEEVVQLSLMLAPHITLDSKLKEAASDQDGTIKMLTAILRTAKVAELASYGQIARERVRVIRRLEEILDSPASKENDFQTLLEEAPWLIHPEWHPVTANQGLETLRQSFEEFFAKRTKKKISLQPFDKTNKRPDFVLLPMEGDIQIIEIKKRRHKLTNDEMERIQTYVDCLDAFLNAPGHEDFKREYRGFKVTLVCDGLGLTGVHVGAFNALVEKKQLEHIAWNVFKLKARKANEEFLKESERQRSLALEE